MSKQVFKQMQIVLEAGENLIIEGPHGTGKTQVITELFNKKFGEGRWAYFSGSTMDPFIDFIGCPKSITTSDGLEVLSLVKPERFARDQIEAIFIDEFNRSPKGVRNAIMELLQFKSINGQKFNNLKIIWAAINPSDGEYDVEEIDPAQFDRFQVQLKIGPEPDKAYFTKKYGKHISFGAINWWNQLPKELRKLVCPRRLDYALAGFQAGRDLSMYLDAKTHPDKLANDIKSGSIEEEIKALANAEEKRAFFKDENKFAKAKNNMQNEDFVSEYILFFPAEKQAMSLQDSYKSKNLTGLLTNIYIKVLNDDSLAEDFSNFKEVIQDMVDSNNDKGFNEEIVETGILTI